MAKETPKDIAEEAIAYVQSHPTDLVFLVIQSNKSLLQRYLHAITEYGKQQVNQQIGKQVKKSFKMKSKDIREEEPLSTLILSHQLFEEELGNLKVKVKL
jgi:hypothetical protein